MANKRLLMRTGVLTGYEAMCKQHGVDAFEIVRGLGLPREILTNPDLYILREVAAGLLASAAEETGSSSFAIDLVDRQQLNAIGAIAYLPFQSETIREGIELIADVVEYHVQSVDIVVRDLAGGLSVVETAFGLPVEPRFRQALEMSFWRTGVFLQALCGDAYAPVEHWFGHPAPDDMARYEARFQAPIRWGKPVGGHGYVLPTETLALAPQRQPNVKTFLVQLMEATGRRGEQENVATETRTVIRSLIGKSRPTLETVAAAMGTYARDLQRQLSESGASFSDLRDSVHLEYARVALGSPDTSITVLALELGYSESSAFSRAFKKWTGSSPSAWRRENLQTGPSS